MIKKNILSIGLVFLLSLLTITHFTGTSMLKKNGTSHWMGADVALATWILERAQKKSSLTEFYQECRWSNEGCYRYDSVPMEWPFLFIIGKAGKILQLDAMSSMDLWLIVSFVLNSIFVYISLFLLTKDRWGSAFCAIAVIFQYSLGQRVAWGHLLLTFISPIILSLVFCYRNLDHIKNNKKTSFISSIVIAISTFATLFTSYYYTGFSFILHFCMIVIFLAVYQLHKNKFFLISSFKNVVLPAVVGGLISLLFNLHIIRGANGVLDGDIHDRSFIGVSLYSARILEFIKPLPDTVLGKFFKIFGVSFANTTIRGEVFSYQGSAVVLSLLFILIFSINKNFKSNLKKFLTSRSTETFCFFMAIAALFFTSKFGGTVVFYTLTKSFRAFSRMAPFATFFLVAFLILWVNRNLKEKTRFVFFGIFFVLSLCESYNSEAFLNLRNYTNSSLKLKIDEVMSRTDQVLPALCEKGYLEMSPVFTKDFLNSQWTIQYFLERHNCQAINGSYISDFKNPDHIKGLKLVGKMELENYSWNGADFLTIKEY